MPAPTNYGDGPMVPMDMGDNEGIRRLLWSVDEIRKAGPGGGGGAGDASAANQATQIAIENAINAKLGTLGQGTMAGSAPVVIASDQSTLPVSAASLPLPAGAATAALQTQPGVDIGDVTANNASNLLLLGVG